MTKPVKLLFDVSFPNITLWVQGCGTVEIGCDPSTDSFIRALDEGGMVWSGNKSYKSLDDALQHLEKGLGQILLDLGLGVQPSAKSRQSARRSTSKQNQAKRQKTPSEPPLPKQVQKFEEIVEAIRGQGDCSGHPADSRQEAVREPRGGWSLCHVPRPAGSGEAT